MNALVQRVTNVVGKQLDPSEARKLAGVRSRVRD